MDQPVYIQFVLEYLMDDTRSAANYALVSKTWKYHIRTMLYPLLFTQGRYYQFVRNHYKPHIYKRRFVIGGQISTLFPTQKNIEECANHLRASLEGNASRKRRQLTNGMLQLKDLPHRLESRPYYHGRCLQFLLDTNRKKYKLSDLIVQSQSEVIIEAERLWQTILEHKVWKYRFNCGMYSDCSWSYGDNRCECGNRGGYWESEGGRSHLDDSRATGYVMTL